MQVRIIELTRGAFGLALLVAPRRMLERVHRVEADARGVAVARLLGARQLAQASLSGASPSAEVVGLGVWVDLAHGATAVGLAAADRPRAFAGLLNAGLAAVWAGWGILDLRRDRLDSPVEYRRRDALARWTLTRLPAGGALLRAAGGRRRS